MSVFFRSFRLPLNTRILRVASVIPTDFTFKNEIASGAVYFSSKDSALVSGSEDILLQNIRSANDSAAILHAVGSHHAIMNTRHLVQALRSLHNLQKADHSTMSNSELMHAGEFRTLCHSLKKQVRGLDDNEIVDCIKILNNFGVPPNVQIMQILLQMVAKQVNDLNLYQISFLDHILKDMGKSPLVEALRLALPIVFEAHLMTKLDRDNVQQLVEVLFFSSKRQVSEKCLTLIVENLMRNRDNISAKEAMSIIRSLCDLKVSNTFYQPLLHCSLDIIVDNVNQCTYSDLDLLASKLIDSYIAKGSCFYHEEFINCCAKFVIQKDLGFEQALWLLKKINKFTHTNMELLDYVAKEAGKAPHLLEQCTAAILLGFVSSLSHANYKPENWSVLEQLILSNASNTLVDRSELPWMKLALELCSLDCWPVQLFETLFHEEFLDKFLSRDRNTDLLQVLALYQAIKSLCPWYTGPLPPQRILDKAIEFVTRRNVEEFPLLAALKVGFGGAQYVHTAVYSKLGHFTDHVIVMRSGGYPVAINHQLDRDLQASRLYLEDLEVTQDCQIVCVVVMQPKCYTVNSERLRGPMDLMLRSLEALGNRVVPVNLTVWHQLPEFERVPYLMQAIRLKAEQGCAEANEAL